MFCYSVIKVSLSCESFYILSHRLLFVKNFFKFFQLLFRSYLTPFFHLFQRKLFFYVVQLSYLITHVLSCQELFSFIWRFSFRFLSNQCVLMCNVCYLIIEFVLRQVFFHFFIFSFRTFIYVLSESFFSSISHLA